MRLLTKFWMNTPIGKLEFTRTGTFTWEMYGTKGGTGIRSVDMPSQKVKPQDVIEQFGWPQNSFSTYGDRYEDVSEVRRIEPAFVTEAPDSGEFHFLARHNRILWFKSAGDLLAYTIQEQQGEK